MIEYYSDLFDGNPWNIQLLEQRRQQSVEEFDNLFRFANTKGVDPGIIENLLETKPILMPGAGSGANVLALIDYCGGIGIKISADQLFVVDPLENLSTYYQKLPETFGVNLHNLETGAFMRKRPKVAFGLALGLYVPGQVVCDVAKFMDEDSLHSPKLAIFHTSQPNESLDEPEEFDDFLKIRNFSKSMKINIGSYLYKSNHYLDQYIHIIKSKV